MPDSKTSPPTARKWPALLFLLAAILLAANSERIALLLWPVNSNGIKDSDISLYATNWCPYCKQARRFFKQANIPYREFNIEMSDAARRQFDQYGGRGVPVIVIGEQIIHGYDKKTIREAIQRLQNSRANAGGKEQYPDEHR